LNKREQIILEKIKQNINDIDYIFTYDTMTYFLYQKYVIRFERSGYMTIFIYGTNKDNFWNNIFYIETENIFKLLEIKEEYLLLHEEDFYNKIFIKINSIKKKNKIKKIFG